MGSHDHSYQLWHHWQWSHDHSYQLWHHWQWSRRLARHLQTPWMSRKSTRPSEKTRRSQLPRSIQCTVATRQNSIATQLTQEVLVNHFSRNQLPRKSRYVRNVRRTIAQSIVVVASHSCALIVQRKSTVTEH